MLTCKEIAQKLLENDSFAIICHVRPDGDAIGSALALQSGLASFGKKADVFCGDTIPSKFGFIDGVYGFNTDTSENYSAFVAVDCADEARLGLLKDKFLSCKNTFNIDHHVSNTRFAKYNFVEENSSNCENIYAVLTEMGAKIDRSVAMQLMLGVSTDTGNFAHKNVTSNTFAVASKLMNCSADINKISYEMFKRQSAERALLFGKTMSKIRYELGGKVGIIVITDENMRACVCDQSETEGFIDFVLGVDTVEVAVSVMEVGFEKYKVSFRSKKPDVNEVAGMFGGGGHVLASGCMINGSIEEVIDRLTFAISRVID
ncbi:MAG: bifunctional oligoribonuclease/PAP phosphatase NrnA [Clostridia bacterium]|nr:bifunctional oligoribonuclease/PAP phosphatase NrnA [Clostridia bacterium]